MRTLKLALAAVAAFAFHASAAPVTGMGNGTTINPPNGMYQNGAFHTGGVAACDGCHVMHNASSGVAKSTTGLGASVAAWSNVTNSYLLQGSDQSSTCLICHSGAKTSYLSTDLQFTIADLTNTTAATGVPTNYTPGGDFGWLNTSMDFTNSPSDRHGHNVAAADFAMATDAQLRVAPGGTWSGAASGRGAFACSSCHDPHGRFRYEDAGAGSLVITGPSAPGQAILPIAESGSYGANPAAGVSAVGVYRLLGGKGYAPASNSAFAFANDPPVAVAPSHYNKPEAGASGSPTRVMYGTGMSEWCQNCHTNIHLDTYVTGRAGLRHPAGSDALFHTTQVDIYNNYVSSGNLTGVVADAYSTLVPFEQGRGVTRAQLLTNMAATNLVASASSNVMCLSCHRAHASPFDSMLRWDGNANLLTDVDSIVPGVTNRSDAQTIAGYYGRNVGTGLGPFQRSLCNKCHAKD
jgi:hypothetical protein